jgi:paraquat-inducible protein B
VGAPIDFRGIVIGEVTAINTRFDPKTERFTIPVEVDLYPELFASHSKNPADATRGLLNKNHELADHLVARGCVFS